MPNYDYSCENCGTVEAFAHMDDIFIECPKCGKAPAKRLFSPPAAKPILDIEPYWDENMDSTPVYITSRRQKADELKKRGLVMKRGIGDGYR